MVPVKLEDKLLGAVVVTSAIDDAFVDGIKNTTGLDTVIYGKDTISTSTLTSNDINLRLIGLKETNSKIIEEVIQSGKEYTSGTLLGDTKYIGAYLPLNDIDKVTVGMLFVGKKEADVMRSAGRSIELTFLISICLIIISTIPAFMISKYISYQIN